MKPTIDCLFIGHHEMNFNSYEQRIKQMGENSGAYRDLGMNFFRYDDRLFQVPEAFNLFCCNKDRRSFKPLRFSATFSAAIAYLGTYLHRRGYTFDYVNSFDDEKNQLAEKLTTGNIRVIAIITTLYLLDLPIIEIVDFIKKYDKTAKIVIGGPFISAQVRTLDHTDLQYALKTMGADYYVDSAQGEAALTRLIALLKKKESPDQVRDLFNVFYKNGETYAATPTVKENNLLSENMVDWNLFAHRIGEVDVINLRTSISCPYSCAFCRCPEYAGSYQTVDVENLRDELDTLAQIGTVERIFFIDDTFNVPRERFKKILRLMVKNRYKFKWHSYFRCQFADRETVELMKESGCAGVFLGLESGSKKILENMNKAASLDKYRQGVALLKEYGIITYGSYIIGFPGETRETWKETLEFIRETAMDFYLAKLWFCDPLTPIWKRREEFNLNGASFEWTHSTMNSATASDLIEELFLTVTESVWVPYYNFDFDGLWYLMKRGMSREQVKRFLRAFNNGIRDKLLDPNRGEASYETIRQIRHSTRGEGVEPGVTPGEDPNNKNHKPAAEFNFTF